jgi:hypothetical protein
MHTYIHTYHVSVCVALTATLTVTATVTLLTADAVMSNTRVLGHSPRGS